MLSAFRLLRGLKPLRVLWSAQPPPTFSFSLPAARKGFFSSPPVLLARRGRKPPSKAPGEKKADEKPSSQQRPPWARHDGSRDDPFPPHKDYHHGSGGRAEGKGGEKGPELPRQPPLSMGELLLAAALFSGMALLTGDREGGGFKTITWQEFYNKMLATGEVARLVVDADGEHVHVFLHDGAIIPGYNDHTNNLVSRMPNFRLSIASVRAFERHMQDASAELGVDLDREIPIVYQKDSSFADSLWSILPMALVLGAWIFITRRTRSGGLPPTGGGGGRGGGQNPMGFIKKDFKPVQLAVKTTFSDVAGLAEAKQELKEFVSYLTKPDAFSSLGAKPPRGALLVGPPGTGKTLLAKAVAGEAGVPFFSVSGSDFVEMFVGVGPSRVRDLFKQAREAGNCIIYIDEIDAMARERGNNARGMSNSERESTLNQLLVEMDGVASTTGILVLASTNRVDILDKALLRPGRFDRHVSCDLPTLLERQDIFRVHMRKLQLSKAMKSSASIERLSQLTPGMSGADIAAVCNEAALHAARHQKALIDVKDFEHAVDRVLMGLERRSRVVSGEERRTIAVHEVGHALVAWFLKHTDPVLKVSIIPRGEAGLGFTQTLPGTHMLHSQEALADRMATLLGGRAAELVMCGRVTTGAHDDLQKVTKLAYALVTQYGMSKSVGPIIYKVPQGSDDGKRKYSDHVAENIDGEAKRLVAEAYDRALAVVQEHKDVILKLSEQLLKAEFLTYEDLLSALGPRPDGATVVTSNWSDLEEEAGANGRRGRRAKRGEGAEPPMPESNMSPEA